MKLREADGLQLALLQLQAGAGAHHARLQHPVIPAATTALLDMHGQTIDAVAAVNLAARAAWLADLKSRLAQGIDIA